MSHYRKKVDKKKAAKDFKRDSTRTHRKNVKHGGNMRGGIRG